MSHKSPNNNDACKYMTLERMGSRYPSRLSFSRSMLRTMVKEKWTIDRVKFDLDKKGYGTAIYEVQTPDKSYSLICFSQYIPDDERSDRVIADKWDTVYALHIGKITNDELKILKKNIPLQEAGRSSPKELVLSRANKSVRLFEKVVDCLSYGKQPDIKEINDVGYLLRTTAVYGSGKFGLLDFERVRFATHFDQPFRAEMLAVYIIREFSIHLVEHVAYHKNPSQAVRLNDSIKQHLGIGNATGLGMAPFIIKHPKLIHKWVCQFDNVLNEIKKIKTIDRKKFKIFILLLQKAQLYLKEVITVDDYQIKKNEKSSEDILIMINYCKSLQSNKKKYFNWKKIIEFAESNFDFDAQEIVKVQIIELFPQIADPVAENMSESDELMMEPECKIYQLVKLIENNYQWAINTDYRYKDNSYLFWYVSEEKLEPRLGERYNEQGAELEQPLGIGKLVNELYEFLKNNGKKIENYTVAEFLLSYPQYRGIIRRIQTLSHYKYGEVKDNILAKNVMPINMLRFKLSFFGASRYDPKSDRWLRISFYAGAPFYNNLNKKNAEEWGFATMNSYN